MKKNSYPTHTKKVKSNRLVILAAVSFLMLTLAAFGFRSIYNSEKNYAAVPKSTIKKDSVASVKAFAKVYSVLMSPRCVNCHPIGDIPLQGDDSHLHKMFPKRGEDGKGVTAMKCANCHQAENISGPHTPPGNPNWHLPPANMKMIFEGRTANQLAKQLIDKKQNGNKDTKQLLEHADDGLVLTGWNPTEGNSLPPLSHSEFKKAWITWLNTGAYAPAK